MDSREVVLRTVEFNKPCRIPRDMWVLPWAETRYEETIKQLRSDYPGDIDGPTFEYAQTPKTQGDAYVLGEYVDEWGCVFVNKQAGIIGEVKDPMLKDPKDWESVRVPTELLTFNAEQVNMSCAKSDKFMLAGCLPRPFERLQFIRGTANLFLDLAMESRAILKLLETIHQFYLEKLTLWCKTDVDGIFIMDDWGSQNSLLISPAMWRKIFKPLYKAYADISHEHGKKIFMHSDGYIIDIIPDLIEIGIDALNCQIFCMGVENLCQFKGRITFWGEICRQQLLPNGSTDDIKQAVEQVKESLWEDGGVIGQCEFGPGSKPDNVVEVFKNWNQYRFQDGLLVP